MNPFDDLRHASVALLVNRGEATVRSLATGVIDAYTSLDGEARLAYFRFLRDEMSVDHDQVRLAATAYLSSPGHDTVAVLGAAAEPVRRLFLRLLNTAPGGTRAIVDMRADLRALLPAHPDLRVLDADFLYLLRSWFNRGFLELRRLDWSTPAFVLEKLIMYEAVHAIRGWSDLHRRLEADRRLYAYQHPALPDEPLIFVEVALVDDVVGSIEDVLRQPAPTEAPASTAAIFYSITNTQAGLAGVSFGNFLIKQVMAELQQEVPSLTVFSTLSPIPGFLSWLRAQTEDDLAWMEPRARARLPALGDTAWIDFPQARRELEPALMEACARYLYAAKRPGSEPPRPLDPVARFHLRNGASLFRLNWMGDPSPKGLAESAGMLVNYLYDPAAMTGNLEAYARDGTIPAGRQIRELVQR